MKKNNIFLQKPQNYPRNIFLRRVPHRRTYFAAIDLGTNNCRMVVAKPTPRSFEIVETFSKVTGLGEEMIKENMLTFEAKKRTLDILKICAKKLSKHNIYKSRFVATEACRRAKNALDFVKEIKNETGLDFEIISPQEEARLAVAGCVPLVARNISHTIVFDIGGGSTEISWAKVNEDGSVKIEGVVSLPFGVVTVTDAFKERELDNMAYDAVLDRAINILDEFDKKHKIIDYIEKEDVQMIGTSGTVTTLGAVFLNLSRYSRYAVDGLTLRIDDVKNVQKRIKEMSMEKRKMHPCIGRSRANFTLAGSAILEAICTFWPLGEITIADRGIREGILLDLMQKSKIKTE